MTVDHDALVVLARRIGRLHPLYAVAERAATEHPRERVAIACSAADWARYAGWRGVDPLTLQPDDFAALLDGHPESTRRERRRGLSRLWDALLPAGPCAADPVASIRVFDVASAYARRLTSDEMRRLVGDAIRDLRIDARRIVTARDLVAIGLLGAGVERLEDLARLRRADLDDAGHVRLDGVDIAVRDAVRVPASILRIVLERKIGPLRATDALVPAVGSATLAAYRRDGRPDMLAVEPAALRMSLGDRLRRDDLDMTFHGRRWTAPSWFVGTGDGTFRLPSDLVLSFAARGPGSSSEDPVPSPKG
jgi:hypothetical protein